MSKLATRKRTVKRSANRRTKHNSIRKSNLRRKVGGSKKRVRKSLKRGGANGTVNGAVTNGNGTVANGNGAEAAPVNEPKAAPVTVTEDGITVNPTILDAYLKINELIQKNKANFDPDMLNKFKQIIANMNKKLQEIE